MPTPDVDLATRLDQPTGSPEQKFMLMMHERIVALESAKDEQATEIERLRKCVADLQVKGYDAEKDRFTDDSFIDWWLWEPVDSAWIGSSFRPPMPLTPAHWDAPVTLPALSGRCHDDVMVAMPVSRYGDFTRDVRLSKPGLTVRKLLTAIYEFYDTPVTLKDLKERDDRTEGYLVDALESLAAGKRVTWMDLVGSCLVGCPGSERPADPPRRHPFMCNGLVRYESIHEEDNRLHLILGS